MVTIQQLRDYAAAHPEEVFPLGEPRVCLAAKCAGKPMRGFDRFEDGDVVEPRFALFLRASGCFDNRLAEEWQQFTGAQLVEALDDLAEPDTAPAGAAERMCDKAGVR